MRRLRKLGHRQNGTSLIELMIAMLVLAVGLLASMALVSTSVGSNSRARRDSVSAALAEMVAGQISSVPIGSATTVTVTDCLGNANTVNITGTAAGAGANLTSTNAIDFTQSYSSVTANYAMRYIVCGVTNGTQSTYDVRWNIKTLPSGKAQMVIVGARFNGTGTTSWDTRYYALPVSVRTVAGTDGN